MSQKITWEQVGKPGNKVLSPAYTVGDLVFTAGALGTRKDGSFPDTIEEQTVLALQNLGDVLKASGSSLENVVKTLVFIKDIKDQKKMNNVYHSIMRHQPARSCVAVIFPNPKVLVEVEAIATKVPKAKL
ncbi:unnamed protein product [Ambrosiozyma monospora]|uniref:Unnamed protein product n=1 Tax=Ambrosiozyma monospora TaxID=43982 RepID=A0ACB5T1S1_AMBMO|nr:unnamed protein product [Ambrosiozyma monospora]